MRICKTRENGRLYRVVALVLALLVGLCGAALAENVEYDIDYNSVQEIFTREACEDALEKAGREPVRMAYGSSYDLYGDGIVASDGQAYLLSISGLVYSYDISSGEYSFLTEVPEEPRGFMSDLSDAALKALRSSVMQLICAADNDVLYGYCPASGLFGTIDGNGIHWSDIKLDNSLSVKYPSGGNGKPRNLIVPFVEGDMLYAYYGPFWEDDPEAAPIYQGQIWDYDLKTGECTATVIERMYTFTPYKSGQALLLRRADDGHLYLSVYDLQAREIVQEEFMVLPVSAKEGHHDSVEAQVCGLAYHEASDSIVYMGAEGPCQSIAGGEFQLIPLEGLEYITEWPILHQSWILEDGTYLYSGGIENFLIK